MADRFAIADIAGALAERRFPTVTMWNRLEGRPRTIEFGRALRAEVRDALWMLTRQWQVGEFAGEDAGSPVLARMRAAASAFTQYRPGDGATGGVPAEMPLETLVEALDRPTTIAGVKAALDLRLVTGRRWLRLIAPIGNYASLYAAKYRIALPDPTQPGDAAICAHSEVWQAFAVVAERATDGIALYQYLTGSAGRHAYDGIAVPGGHQSALDLAAEKFVAFVEQVLPGIPARANPAWQPRRFEYRFSVSAPTAAGDKAYLAEEYAQGRLDWHSLDVEPAGIPADPAPVAAASPTDITRTLIPVPATYPGMPLPRWWALEDGRTSFAGIRPDTTDLAKLLFTEFGLVYSNDWFTLPFTVAIGSVVGIEGMVVTNVFGERFLVGAAGAGVDDDWQRWSLFTSQVRGRSPAAADTNFALLPVTAKVQEGPPLEQVLFMRDEMANMVWAIERTIPGADGTGRSGGSSARETRAFFERLAAAAGPPPATPELENDATIRYEVMTSVPENWIPFVPVRPINQGPVELQRATMMRIIEGDTTAPRRVEPRTSLLRLGLDSATYQPLLVPEEEVPRAGVVISITPQRARWLNGKVATWLGASKHTGRGEGSSGLAFDRLADKP